MRFTTLFYTGVFALATAQSTTGSVPTTTDAATAAQSSQQAAIIACLNACKEGDVDCAAKCITVPNPSDADANATNKCVAECPKGNGTATDNLNYANCVDGCISKFYYTVTGVGAQPTGGAGSGSGSGSGNTDVAVSGSSKPTGTASNQATTTGGAASTSTSGNFAAPGFAAAGSTAGFVGFLAALLAI